MLLVKTSILSDFTYLFTVCKIVRLIKYPVSPRFLRSTINVPWLWLNDPGLSPRPHSSGPRSRAEFCSFWTTGPVAHPSHHQLSPWAYGGERFVLNTYWPLALCTHVTIVWVPKHFSEFFFAAIIFLFKGLSAN